MDKLTNYFCFRTVSAGPAKMWITQEMWKTPSNPIVSETGFPHQKYRFQRVHFVDNVDKSLRKADYPRFCRYLRLPWLSPDHFFGNLPKEIFLSPKIHENKNTRVRDCGFLPEVSSS